VRRWDDAVLAALHEQDRRLDARDVEPPRGDEGDVVVNQAVGPGGAGADGVVAQ
jgi:hypothetical protein